MSIALENNYEIKIARNTSEIAAFQNEAANANFLPVIDGNASTLNSINNVNQELSSNQTIKRDGARSSNLNASVNLTYTLFDGLKMFATKKKTTYQEELSELQLKNQIQLTVAEITLAYYGLVQQQQQLKAIEEAISISEERVKIAEKKFNIGASPKTDLLQSRVDLNAQRSKYLRQKALTPISKANLNRLLARDELIDFEVDEEIKVSYSPDKAKLKTSLSENNLELLSAKQSLLIREQSLRELKGDAMPKLNFNSSYVFSQAESQAGFLLVNQNLGFNYGLSLTVPIFRGFRLNKGVQAAKIDANSALLEYDNAKQRVNVALQKAFIDYETVREVLLLEEENIQLAKENVIIALEKFRLSQSSILDLKEAQRSYEEALSRLITARFTAKQAEITLRQLNGELVR